MPDDDVVAEETSAPVGDVAVDDDDEFKPRGTMVIMLVFLAVIALIWVFAYLTLLYRG